MDGPVSLQTACQGTVVLDGQLQIHEDFFSTRHGLTAQTLCLVDQFSFEDFLNPCRSRRSRRRGTQLLLFLFLLQDFGYPQKEMIEEFMGVLPETQICALPRMAGQTDRPDA